MKRAITLVFAFFLLPGFSSAIDQVLFSGSGFNPNCSTGSAVVARLDGTQNAAHNTAYMNLICGLVFDGVWAKLDVFYVFATNDTTNALTNLVSSSFTATASGGPTFTADTGYVGTDASTTKFLNTNFNNNQAGALFTQNSGHFSVWNNSNLASSASGGFEGVLNTGDTAPFTNILPKYSDGNQYFRVNDSTTVGQANAAVSDPRGHIIANRTTSSAVQGYFNGNNVASSTVTSTTPIGQAFYILATRQAASAAHGDPHQIMAASIGGSLTATDALNFYKRLHTYLVSIAGITY